MKHILSFLLCLCTLQAVSQQKNNSIGISPGSVTVNPLTPSFGTTFLINSVFYNSPAPVMASFQKSSFTPTLYFSKRIYRKLHSRLSANYGQHTLWTDHSGWTNCFPVNDHVPFYSANRIHVFQITSGLEYRFRKGKFDLYPAIEFCGTLWRSNSVHYYTRELIPHQVFVRFNRDRHSEIQPNLLAGAAYQLTPSCSISYEGGLYRGQLAPLSRLSVNYQF